MKTRIYLRVAKTENRKGYKVSAGSQPSNEPLNSGSYNTTWFPTVAFALDIDVPDEMFKTAERVIAELNVNMKEAQISTELVVPKGITVKKAK
jgi:hypothetical protein